MVDTSCRIAVNAFTLLVPPFCWVPPGHISKAVVWDEDEMTWEINQCIRQFICCIVMVRVMIGTALVQIAVVVLCRKAYELATPGGCIDASLLASIQR